MLNITRKVVILFLISVLLLNTTNSLYAVNKIYKKWYFWAGIVTITGVVYYQQEEDKKKNQTVQPVQHPTTPAQPIWVTDPNGDADGDGYTNIVEHREGSDPNDPKSIPQEGSHTLSAHGMKAADINPSLKFSFIPNTSIKNTPICIIVPLKKDIWVSWTANLNMSDYKIQAMLKY